MNCTKLLPTGKPCGLPLSDAVHNPFGFAFEDYRFTHLFQSPLGPVSPPPEVKPVENRVPVPPISFAVACLLGALIAAGFIAVGLDYLFGLIGWHP